ncbi:MAG: Crp/Fnr family transcriptional regulator [Nitrospira sp.]|nr:Crp/Fnr family transcriptional regulator [Nitrospira sp.]
MKPDPLSRLPLFEHLSPTERRKIAGDIVETRYRKDQFIFREGDPANCFHILKEGTVKCVKTSPQGKQVTLKVLMPGDLFCCDAAALNDGTHPGCAQPMGDVSVLTLSKDAYLKLLRRNPDAAIEIIQYLGARLSEAQETAKVLALNPAEQRMAALLVKFATRAGLKDDKQVRLTVRLTRQDLADMIGVTVETATRIMSRFKRDKLVAGTAKSLTICNLPRLQQMASNAPCPPTSPRHAHAG